GLRKEGIADVPIIDPAIVALKVAEALADIGLSHSKRTYPIPPEKDIVGYEVKAGASPTVVEAPRQHAAGTSGNRIRVITPGIDKELEAVTLAQYSAGARADTDLSVVYLDRGPAAIESSYDEALAVPDIVSKAVQAEQDGMDAVLLDCMANPGLAAAREKVSILVLGPASTSMHLAAMLGHKFSVITILDSRIPQFEQHALDMGLEWRLASVRSVNIPVLELDDQTRTTAAMIEQAVKAVKEDGAHVLIFGCTGMIGLDENVKEGLAKQGISDVPVIDPGILNLKMAEALADIGLTHSKRTYPVPPEKEILGY
ncbi:MAG: aspartate/glutamate racemase family protein, partial [Anaerolineae bacterium]|nr:aspartate/glutamate racemase family protein [Anaerolineae bacterium]